MVLSLFLMIVSGINRQTQYIDVNDPRMVQRLQSVEMHARIELEGVESVNGKDTLILQLERFRVFSRDAMVVIHGDSGDRVQAHPTNTYFRGRLLGDPFSNAFVAVHADGSLFGMVNALERRWAIGGEPGGVLIARELTAENTWSKGTGFSCGVEGMNMGPPATVNPGMESMPAKAAGGNYQVTVAAETDFEYYSMFGNTTDATNYIADLVGYSSSIYLAELNTTMVVGDVSLWTTAADPWTESAANCMLYQFGRYWNDNNAGIARTTTHFFSGRPALSGIAWVGVLCNGAFNVDLTGAGCSLAPIVDNYGGNYGVTQGLSGAFDINNPQVIWDIVAVAHEIGHNFNSPHTHCYNGIGGNANPIDECNNQGAGCYSGSTSLPCGMPGGGCGTIMSYCHLLSPGMSNVSLTLGLGHPFGVEPERVPTRMSAHVVSRSSSFPACIPFLMGNAIFSDGFESGDTSMWSTTIPKRSSLNVNANAALVETRGLEVTLTGTSLAYVQDNSPNDESIYRWSLRFDPNTANYPQDEDFLLVDTRDPGNISRVGLEYSTGNGHRARLFVREDDATLERSAWIALVDGDQELELEWRQSSAPGANDGTAIFYLDGTFQTALDCLDTDSQVITSTAVGATRSLESGGTGSFYVDAFASFDDSSLILEMPLTNFSQWPAPDNVLDLVGAQNAYRCVN